MSIQKMLEQLDSFWNASSDLRFKGEHPDCDRIQDMLIKEFRKLPDDELLKIISPMNDGQLQQIYSVLITLLEEDEREIVSAYIRA